MEVDILIIFILMKNWDSQLFRWLVQVYKASDRVDSGYGTSAVKACLEQIASEQRELECF